MALTKAQLVDLNANELIIDLDADTSITADTDDQIDIKIAGADDFRFTANTFTALSGSTIAAQALTATTITTTGAIAIANDGNIGSAGDADAIAISSSGVVTFSQSPVFPDGSLAVVDLDIDGATDIGADLADADLLLVDDGAGGTNRKTAMSRIKTYVADVTLTTAAQTNITSLGTLSALTVDDVAGRIDLSADDNGEVRLFDGSSQYAQFKDDSDRFRIESMISDADMMFVGNDGGSEVTAGFFDMSAAGVFELTRGAIRLKKLTEEAESNSMMIDSSGATGISIANTAEVEISSHLNMSGMILINDPTQSGQVALFITGGGQMVEVGDTGSTFVVGSSPASGKIGVFLDSNKVHVKNNLGNACTINIQTFRTRTSQ